MKLDASRVEPAVYVRDRWGFLDASMGVVCGTWCVVAVEPKTHLSSAFCMRGLSYHSVHSFWSGVLGISADMTRNFWWSISRVVSVEGREDGEEWSGRWGGVAKEWGAAVEIERLENERK